MRCSCFSSRSFSNVLRLDFISFISPFNARYSIAPILQEDVGSSLQTPNGTDVEARFEKDSSVGGIKFSLPESAKGAAGGTCVAEVFDEDVVKNLLEINGVE